jgi:hypothetical protein
LLIFAYVRHIFGLMKVHSRMSFCDPKGILN